MESTAFNIVFYGLYYWLDKERNNLLVLGNHEYKAFIPEVLTFVGNLYIGSKTMLNAAIHLYKTTRIK